MTDTKSNLFLMIFVSSKNWKSVLKNRYYYCIFLQSVSVSWFPPEIRNLNLKTDTKPAFLLNLFLFHDFLQKLKICNISSSSNTDILVNLNTQGVIFSQISPPRFLKKVIPGSIIIIIAFLIYSNVSEFLSNNISWVYYRDIYI